MATNSIKNTTVKHSQEMSLRTLRKANRSFTMPFQVQLQDQNDFLYCDQIVRIIPGKRMVVFGSWRGKSIVAKLFYEFSHAKRHFEREKKGIEAMLQARIPSPRLFYQGSAKNVPVYILIFEKISYAKSLDELWKSKTNMEDLFSLMKAVTLEIATQHVVGIIQHDLHFKNFLIKDKQIFTLDGGSIECFNDPLSKKLSLNNLALFFVQFGVGTEKLQQDLFDCYIRARGWIVKASEIKFFQLALQKWSAYRWSSYNKKINRNSTAFLKIHSPQRLLMYDQEYQTPEFLNFLANPDAIFHQPTTEFLKQGRSSTVIKTHLDKKSLVIKRYNIKDSWHWLRRCLRSTRAAKTWRIAHLLQLMGIATPRPVAFIEKRFLGLRGKSYLVMEHIDGPNLGDYLAENANNSEKITIIAERVSQLIKNLAKLQICHGDLKMTNILIENDQPVLLDLDGVKENQSNQKQDVKRFLQNWQHQPEIKALFESLLEYSAN